MLEKIKNEINASIEQFLDHVGKDYQLHLVDPLLFQSIREFSLREGKRIRPMLLVLGYLGYAKPGTKPTRSLYHASTCMEFLHNFMLIHDDIIDCSDVRRGRPAMHRMLSRTVRCANPAKLGVDLAIIAGDIVYALAIDAFLSIQENPKRKEQALKYFIQTAAFTAMGEFVDTVHGVDTLNNVKEKDVFLNYSLKTARYTFDCPLVTAAILAGAPQSEITKLNAFGLGIGQAFQIQDDIIGLYGTEKEIGKSVLCDLEEQKKTLLIVHAYNTLKGRQLAKLKKIFHQKNKSMSDLEEVKKLVREAGSLQYSLDAVNSRVSQAKTILGEMKMQPKFKNLIGESLFSFFHQSAKITERYC